MTNVKVLHFCSLYSSCDTWLLYTYRAYGVGTLAPSRGPEGEYTAYIHLSQEKDRSWFDISIDQIEILAVIILQNLNQKASAKRNWKSWNRENLSMNNQQTLIPDRLVEDVQKFYVISLVL